MGAVLVGMVLMGRRWCEGALRRCRRSRLGGGALALFLGMGARGVPDPGARGLSAASRAQPFGIAWTVAFQDLVEFGPVDRSKLVLLLDRVPPKQRIGNGEVQKLGLRHGEINEFLPQFIVRKALDFPAL